MASIDGMMGSMWLGYRGMGARDDSVRRAHAPLVVRPGGRAAVRTPEGRAAAGITVMMETASRYI